MASDCITAMELIEQPPWSSSMTVDWSTRPTTLHAQRKTLSMMYKAPLASLWWYPLISDFQAQSTHTALQAHIIWNIEAVRHPEKFSASAWWRDPGRLQLWILLILIYSDIHDVRLKSTWKSTAAVNSQWEWLEIDVTQKFNGWTLEHQFFTVFLDFRSARVWTNYTCCSQCQSAMVEVIFFQTRVKTPSVTLDTATLLRCVDSADIFQCPSMWCCWVAVGSMSTWSPACQCKTSVGSLDSMILVRDTKNLLTRALVCNRIHWFDILIMLQYESHCRLNTSSTLILNPI